MKMENAVIVTGGSRGIGLEFTKRYLQKGFPVVSCSRNAHDSEDLKELKSEFPDKLFIYQLDVERDESITQFVSHLKNENIIPQILINNAGIASGNEKFRYKFGELESSDLLRTFHINTISPVILSQNIVPMFSPNTQNFIINISSDSGSITKKAHKGSYGYSASKTAMNMMTKIMSLELKENGITVVALHPGWVRTTMVYTDQAPLSVEESVGGMIKVMDNLTISDSGKFLDWNGHEMSW